MNTTAYDSPALREQSPTYPVEWMGRVPKRVRMNKTVQSKVPWIGKARQPVAIGGTEFDVWVNRNGAVTALFESGEPLGLRPDEFTIIEWHGGEKEVV